MLPASVKKNIVILLIVTNLATGLYLGYVAWRQMFWQMEAMTTADFAAKVWASNNYEKGKLIKLELVVKDKPEVYQPKQNRFDGSYVVLDWIGYTDPLWRFNESPSILVAQEFVRTYNAEMNGIVSDPNAYEQRIRKEVDYWRENALNERPAGLKTTADK
ncbi:MAG: hypothetical protein WAK60_02315 [Sedimentisphaerales bacterium]